MRALLCRLFHGLWRVRLRGGWLRCGRCGRMWENADPVDRDHVSLSRNNKENCS